MINFFKRLWKSNWRNKLTLIVGFTVLVVAAVSIIYGVVTKEGDEGLMKIEGVSLRWDKSDLPIICVYDPVTITVDDLALYDIARSEINTKTKINFLGPCIKWEAEGPIPVQLLGNLTIRIGRPGAEPLVNNSVLEFEDPFKPHPGGITSHRFDKNSGYILSASIFIDPNAPKDLLNKIWLHELGHVLGLAHDRLSGSIMFSTVSSRAKSLSKKDVKTLQDSIR